MERSNQCVKNYSCSPNSEPKQFNGTIKYLGAAISQRGVPLHPLAGYSLNIRQWLSQRCGEQHLACNHES